MPAGIRTETRYWTAYDQPDWCSGWDFTCKMKAVGAVIFNSHAAAAGLPIGVPLPLCPRHYDEVRAINKESPIPILVNQFRYNGDDE